MKFRKLHLGLVLGVVLGALALAACGGSSSSSGSTSAGNTTEESGSGSSNTVSETNGGGKEYTVGFSVPILSNPTVSAAVQGIASVLQENNSKLIVKDANLQGNQQVSDIDELTAQGVDAMVVWATTEPKTLAPALERATEAGIPIFSIDGTGDPKEVTDYEQPSERMGQMAAELMSENVGSGQVAVIGGVPAPSIITRVNAFKKAVETKYPKLEIVEEQDNLKDVAAGAEPLVANMLTKYPELKGVYTYNDPSAIGASAAARSDERELVIIGNNADPEGVAAVEDGRITASVDAKPVETGENAGNGVIDYLDGKEKNPPKTVKIEPAIVTKENVGSFVPWAERTPEVNYSEVCTGCTG